MFLLIKEFQGNQESIEASHSIYIYLWDFHQKEVGSWSWKLLKTLYHRDRSVAVSKLSIR